LSTLAVEERSELAGREKSIVLTAQPRRLSETGLNIMHVMLNNLGKRPDVRLQNRRRFLMTLALFEWRYP
jgi:hypothetical protein